MLDVDINSTSSIFIRVIGENLRLNFYENSPEEIEAYRDRKWRRDEALKVETARKSSNG